MVKVIRSNNNNNKRNTKENGSMDVQAPASPVAHNEAACLGAASVQAVLEEHNSNSSNSDSGANTSLAHQ